MKTWQLCLYHICTLENGRNICHIKSINEGLSGFLRQVGCLSVFLSYRPQRKFVFWGLQFLSLRIQIFSYFVEFVFKNYLILPNDCLFQLYETYWNSLLTFYHFPKITRHKHFQWVCYLTKKVWGYLFSYIQHDSSTFGFTV